MDAAGEGAREMAAIDGEAVGLQWPEWLMVIVIISLEKTICKCLCLKASNIATKFLSSYFHDRILKITELSLF